MYLSTMPMEIRRWASTGRAQRTLLHGLAAGILAVVLWLNVLFWPLPHLGFDADPLTGRIAVVQPGSSAERAGLRAGDRILRLYNHAWTDLVALPNALPLVSALDPNVPITFARGAPTSVVILTGILVKQPPSFALQTAKVAMAMLALLCWMTGYILGIVRRQESTSAPLVAYFWLGLAGVIGIYDFALNISLPLYVCLQWCLLAVLSPLAVLIHCSFPISSLTARQHRWVQRSVLASSALLTLSMLTILVIWPGWLVHLAMFLSAVLVPIGILGAMVASGLLMRKSYRRAPSAHARRQVRLIALACFFSSAGWILLVLLPIWITLPSIVADQRTNVVVGCVPLAYLISGITPNLYRIDRIMLRLALHATVILILATLLAGLTRLLDLQSQAAALWAAVAFVACYRPIQRTLMRVVPGQRLEQRYAPLHTAATQLTTTLDSAALIHFLITGVYDTFDAPALAFYHGTLDIPNQLLLRRHERLGSLPATIGPGMLTEHIGQASQVTVSRDLAACITNQPLNSAEAELLHHPGIIVWGPIRRPQGALLGLLLLGMRGDLDPYRARDLHELQRLLDAAALAFTNSAAYAAQCEAEATIRTLYQRLHAAQQATAAAIARELHDEIINVSVRLNIEALQRLRAQISDPRLQGELTLVLETEQSLVDALRMVCERLHPVGIDDLLGLAAVLRMQLEYIRATWPGECQLIVMNAPQPVAAAVQYEVMQISREALTNAVKHARNATQILVELRYPPSSEGMIHVNICDNGQGMGLVMAKPGHWGLRGMQERARLIGGQLDIHRQAEGGTVVSLTFSPAAAANDDERLPDSEEKDAADD